MHNTNTYTHACVCVLKRQNIIITGKDLKCYSYFWDIREYGIFRNQKQIGEMGRVYINEININETSRFHQYTSVSFSLFVSDVRISHTLGYSRETAVTFSNNHNVYNLKCFSCLLFIVLYIMDI